MTSPEQKIGALFRSTTKHEIEGARANCAQTGGTMDDTLKALNTSDGPDRCKSEVTGSTLNDEVRSRIIAGILEALRAAGYECELDQVNLH